jgi:hypothetical protein
LPLTERSRNQTPRGIGPLPEQTLRNPNHVGDNKSSASYLHEPTGRERAPATSGLIGLSNTLDRHGTDRASFRKNVERALRVS